MFSAARIIALRKSKGFSQEVLAEQSGISLRTIQRVERGETEPRGHTLQALATALAVPLEALLAEPAPIVAVPQPVLAPVPALRADPDFLQLLNLSALSFLVFPLLNILVPWWLWRRRRYTVEHVAVLGRRVLGFQVWWQVGSFFAFLLVVVVQVLLVKAHHAGRVELYFLVLGVTYACNVAVIGYNARQLRRGVMNHYWPIF
jgi:transcriptional regulator with XRE-family HTH domain